LSVEHMSFVLGHAIALAWGGAPVELFEGT
jgi:hypothetical protein